MIMGGWNAIRYQILDPPQIQVLYIRPPPPPPHPQKKSNRRYLTPQQIKYQISHTLKHQISDIQCDVKLQSINQPNKLPTLYLTESCWRLHQVVICVYQKF